MEKRLIYKDGPEVAVEAENPEVGKTEFFRLRDEIGKISPSQIDRKNLDGLFKKIDDLYVAISKSEVGVLGSYKRGEFFKELFTALKDKFQLQAVAEGKKSQIASQDEAQTVCFFADPDAAARAFITDSPDKKWDNARVKKYRDAIEKIGGFYASSNPEYYTGYVRGWFHELNNLLEPDQSNRETQELKGWLAYQSKNFEFTVVDSLDWLAKPGQQELEKQARRFNNLGKSGDYRADGEAFKKALDVLGAVENNVGIETILSAGGINLEDIADQNKPEYYAPAKVYLILAWSFYKGLIDNPKATVEQRQIALAKHNDVFKEFPSLRFNFDEGERLKVADEAAAGVAKQPKGAEKKSDKKSGRIVENDLDADEDDLLTEEETVMLEEGGDSDPDAYELPRVMSEQMERLTLISDMAGAIIGSRAGEDDEAYAGSILNHLEAVEGRLRFYYMGDEDHPEIPPKYDGQTPFKLEEMLKSSDSYNVFIADFSRLIKEGPRYVDRPTKHGIVRDYDVEKSALAKYLCDKFDDMNMAALAVRMEAWRKGPYTGELVTLLNGGQGVGLDTVKKAGVAILKFQRHVLKDHVSSRALGTKLLKHQLKKPKERAANDPKVVAQIRGKVGIQALRSVSQFLKGGGEMALRVQIRAEYAKIHGADKEMPPKLLEKTYRKAYNVMVENQEEVLFDAALTLVSLSNRFLDPEKLGGIDRDIYDELYDSVQPDGKEMSDDTAMIWSQIASLSFDVLLAIVPLTGALVASGLAKKAYHATRFAKMLMAPGKLEGMRTALYWACRGMVGTATEVSVFCNAFPAMKGKETLFGSFGKKGIWEDAKKMALEMAKFGFFHGMNFLNVYLKQGMIGRNLMRLALKDPRQLPVVEECFRLASLKNGQKALENALEHGVRLGKSGVARKLPKEIAGQVEMALGDVRAMQERYTVLIDELPEGHLKNICGVLVQDLHFDVVAALLGSALEHGMTSKKTQRMTEDTIADTILHAYGGALAFRGAFMAKNVAGKWMKARLPGDVLADSAVDLRLDISAVKEALSKLPNEAHVKDKAALEALQSQREALELKLENLRAREKVLDEELKVPSRLGDFPIPGRLARFMPRRLVERLYRDYQVDGKFIGSDGLINMLLTNFAGAMNLINGAVARGGRSLLTVNQTLTVASRLSREQCMKFVSAQSRLMTKGQRDLFMKMAEGMKLEVPDYIDAPARYRRNPTARARHRRAAFMKFLRALMVGGALFVGAATMGGKGAPAERAVATASAKAPGELPGPSRFEALPNAGERSSVTITKVGSSATKELDLATSSRLFEQPQQSIFDSLAALDVPVAPLEALYESFPEPLRPYLRVVVDIDDEQNSEEYVVLNRDALERAFGDMPISPEDIAGLTGLDGINDIVAFKAFLAEHDPESLKDFEQMEVQQAGFGFILALLIASSGLFGVGDLLGLAKDASLFALQSPLVIALIWFRYRKWISALVKGIGKNSSEKKQIEAETKGEGIEFDKDLRTQITNELPGQAGPGAEFGNSPGAEAVIRKSQGTDSFDAFYNTCQKKFGQNVRFRSADEGKEVFIRLVKLGYITRRIKTIDELLKTTDPLVKSNPKPPKSPTELAAEDVRLRDALKQERSELEAARDKLKERLDMVKVMDSVTYVTLKGKQEVAELVNKEVESTLKDQGFSGAEIAQIKAAARDYFNLLQNLGKNMDKLFKLEAARKILEPAMNKAKDVLYESDGTTAKARPDETADPAGAAVYDKALATEAAYKKIVDDTAFIKIDMGKIGRAISKVKLGIDKKGPWVRKSIHALLLASTLGLGYGVYQGVKKGAEILFPAEPEPEKPKTEVEQNQEARSNEQAAKRKTDADKAQRETEAAKAAARKAAADKAAAEAAAKAAAKKKTPPPVKTTPPGTIPVPRTTPVSPPAAPGAAKTTTGDGLTGGNMGGGVETRLPSDPNALDNLP